MIEQEKKLLQAQHRVEEAQARNRVMERKARTRRLIQEGAILEKLFPAVSAMDGHNPHVHIMLTVRPLDEQGKWQYKTEKEYLCVKNGEERGFTAVEFKAAQVDGWEKQYQYKVGRKKVYLPPTEAEAKGYERLNKHPKSTKYGRQKSYFPALEQRETAYSVAQGLGGNRQPLSGTGA